MRSNTNNLAVDENVGVVLSSTCLSGAENMRIVELGLYGEAIKILAFETPHMVKALDGPLHVHRFYLTQPHDAKSRPFLLETEWDPLGQGLCYLPQDYCPVDGVVIGIRNLLGRIKTRPLSDFVATVLQRRDVHQAFWTMPASRRDHHSFDGGLAAHSLEVASDLMAHAGLSEMERDLGAAGALLHDIGKVWSYTEDMFPNVAGLAMGHELVGLCRLEPQLLELEDRWADGAYVMRALLGGQSWKRGNGTLPSSLLPRIKACDQRSCERDLAASGGHHNRRPVWTPQPWR